MADSGLSKQQKKRQKRAAKNLLNKINQEKEVVAEPTPDPLTILKNKLAEAKKNGNIDLAKELRQDIWVLQDTTAGHKPSLSKEEVNTSLNRITANCERPAVKTETSTEVRSTLTPMEKRLRNLNKKLEQIDALKDRLKKGEKLETTQITKIESEFEIRKEIEEINSALACTGTT